MTKPILLAALIATGLAFAPAAAFAEDAMKPAMSKDNMAKKDDKDKMTKSSDKMKKTDGMMDKKDAMSKDK